MPNTKNNIGQAKVHEGVGIIYVQVSHSKTAPKEAVQAKAIKTFTKYITDMDILTDEYETVIGGTIEKSTAKATSYFSFLIHEQ